MVLPLATVLVQGVIQGVGPGVLGAGLTARGGPFDTAERSPKIAPGAILRLALDIQALSEAGRTPVVSTDPFTGDTVLSTAGQQDVLFDILGERFARETLRGTPEESAEIFRQREAFIESRRQFPVFPGGPEAAVNQIRANVVADLSRVSPTVIAPGVVSSARPAAMSRRLAGPCAGITTGFERLKCARGGIS